MRHILVVALALSAQPAFALTYFLTQDLGVRGLQHLCLYSNGKVYAVNATDLCPLQVNDNPATSTPPATRPGNTGFKIGEYQDGLTKVCIYNVLGDKKAVRVDGTELCPQTYNF